MCVGAAGALEASRRAHGAPSSDRAEGFPPVAATISVAAVTKASICTALSSPVVCSVDAGGKRRVALGPDTAAQTRERPC